MYQNSLVGADAHQGFLVCPTYPLIKMDYQLCRRPLSLSLEDPFGAAYNLLRRLSAPSKPKNCLVSPITSRNNPEGAAAVGNHLIVAVITCLSDVYL